MSGLSSGVAALSAGSEHLCAMLSTGSVLCWGANLYGQLGDGTNMLKTTPTAVSGLSSGVVALACGTSSTCAVLSTGGVKCWGLNNYGQLGDGTIINRLTPTAVSGLSSGVAAIAAGIYYTCALLLTGDVKCWGSNGNGALGTGTITDMEWIPTALSQWAV